MDHKTVLKAIRSSLTIDLLSPRFREWGVEGKSNGHCYVASEAVFHMLGGKKAGYKGVTLNFQGYPHWWVVDQFGRVLDPTADQYDVDVPYEKGKGCGFLTRQPSKRAAIVIKRAKKILKRNQ
jgi:hypothetical protein